MIRIQPDEAIYLKINNKIPGLGLHLDVTKLDLTYRERFKGARPLRGLLHVHVESVMLMVSARLSRMLRCCCCE